MNVLIYLSSPPTFITADTLDVSFAIVTSTGINMGSNVAMGFGVTAAQLKTAVTNAAKEVLAGTPGISTANFKVMGGAF